MYYKYTKYLFFYYIIFHVYIIFEQKLNIGNNYFWNLAQSDTYGTISFLHNEFIYFWNANQ